MNIKRYSMGTASYLSSVHHKEEAFVLFTDHIKAVNQASLDGAGMALNYKEGLIEQDAADREWIQNLVKSRREEDENQVAKQA